MLWIILKPAPYHGLWKLSSMKLCLLAPERLGAAVTGHREEAPIFPDKSHWALYHSRYDRDPVRASWSANLQQQFLRLSTHLSPARLSFGTTEAQRALDSSGPLRAHWLAGLGLRRLQTAKLQEGAWLPHPVHCGSVADANSDILVLTSWRCGVERLIVQASSAGVGALWVNFDLHQTVLFHLSLYCHMFFLGCPLGLPSNQLYLLVMPWARSVTNHHVCSLFPWFNSSLLLPGTRQLLSHSEVLAHQFSLRQFSR